MKFAYWHYKNLLLIFLKGTERTLRSFFQIKRTERSFHTIFFLLFKFLVDYVI